MKRKQLSKAKRQAVWEKYNGKCAYCGCDLGNIKNMTVDHIEPVWLQQRYTKTKVVKYDLDKNNIENLNPSCKACNNYKGGDGIECFRDKLKNMLNVKRNYLFASTTKQNLAQNYRAVTYKEWDGLFYFEKVELEKIANNPHVRDNCKIVLESMRYEENLRKGMRY